MDFSDKKSAMNCYYFSGMKYDLRRVEEVYYDVKIRGLFPEDKKHD